MKRISPEVTVGIVVEPSKYYVETVSGTFLCWFMGSDAAKRQFSEGSGGAIQQHFNIGTALNMVVPHPPQCEQQGIADFLDRVSRRIGE